MIGESSLFVRVCRQRANLASGLEIAIRYEARDGDLGNWPSWGATRAEIVLPANAPEPSDLVYQVARALQPLLHSAGVPGLDDLLVRVQHPDLSGLNWEWLASTLSRKVVRYSRRIAAHAYEPVDLPLSVLFVNAGGNYESSYDDRLAISFRYFRTVQASRQSGADVQRLIAGSQFDIVHLGVRLPAIDPSGRSDEVQHTDGSIFEPRTLEGALRRARTRLLVLEGQDAPPATLVFPLEALRRLAHRIHEATGVAVIASGPANFGQFYYGLTHDQYLTELVKSVRPGINDLDQGPALWLRQGGDAVLRLMGASARIAAEVLQEHQRVEAAYEAQFASGAPKGMTYDQAASRATVEALERLTRLRGETYSFDQESHGVEPISRSRAELLDIQRLRSGAVPEPARVVNTWVQAGGRALPASSSLGAGSKYQLIVNIGRPDRRSAAVAPAAIDETAVTDAYVDGFSVLTVVVSSTDFGVDRPSQPLRLPPPQDDSEPVLFTISTPTQPGSYRLRVGIYHRTNLLQSLIMTVAVTADRQPLHPFGHRAELEWALSSTFRNLDEMEEPALTIVSNEDPEGTHTFVVYGAVEGSAADIHRQVDLPPDVLKTTIDDARTDLQNVCATFKNGTLDKYRFDRDNRSNRSQLLADLKVLALAGSGLFIELTTSDDARFNAELENRLRGTRLIQIASVKSANYVFPWSLVYDHEFRESPSNILCDVVRGVIDQGGNVSDLQQTECFVDECPSRSDPMVVCPAGFWGFRHRIEQPLLAPPILDEDNAATGGTPRHDVTTAISVGAGSLPRVVIGVSESLADWEPHTTRAGEQFGGISERVHSIDPLLEGLRRLDLHLAYFYCHGGRRGNKAFLGLGSRREVERLFPQYLKSVSWPGLHPFIFINGCRTVGVSPDDLLSFNKMFARAPASGILGTEISVPEELAQHVAHMFFESFPRGVPVGQIVRDIRLDLLMRCNPLGLAYTPYCMAALHLAR